MQDVRQAVRDIIRDAKTRLTQLDIERRLSLHCQIGRRSVRSAIKALVDEQELMYVSDFGHTFIETALNKPIRIAATVVLKPCNCTFEQGAGDIVVSLCHGASFGSGQHPTTRLCLEGLAWFLQKESVPWPAEKARALDIGTGSGVLIITAVKMGIASGIGLDVDPCAVSEARANVAHNKLSERIVISSQDVEAYKGPFDLILANLRWPTLASYLPQMVDKTMPDGAMLLSGVKSEELDAFVKQSRQYGLKQAWMGEEHGWAAILFQQKG